jgi:hypothetical protein
VVIGFPSSFTIKHQSDEWQYRTMPVYKRYKYEYAHHLIRMQDLQVEPGGDIYLLMPRSKNVVSQFPSQPLGFPLKPETTSNQ